MFLSDTLLPQCLFTTMLSAFSPGLGGSPQSAASRGGRPREWTDSRSRQLARMYLYSDSKLDIILEALKDPTWKPQKDAANKILHRLLGNDPRWLRPKSKEESQAHIRCLEASNRPIHRQHSAPPLSLTDTEPLQLATTDPFQTNIELDYYPPDVGDFAWPPLPDPLYSPASWERHLRHAGSIGLNAAPELPQLHRRGSALSILTVSSMASSFVERLKSKEVPSSDMANLWKLSRRYTMPKSAAPSPHPSALPVRASPPGHHAFPSLDMPSDVDHTSAGYAVPGDYINLGSRFSFVDRRSCDQNSRAHDEKKCWCAVTRALFDHFQRSGSSRVALVSNPQSVWHLNQMDITARDDFGHTPLHVLASVENCQAQLLAVVAEALDQESEILRVVNTAGQSFLHVLHPFWFSRESKLKELIGLLKQHAFDILGRDVYGRNIFHTMREHGASDVQTENCAQGLDKKTINRRDAFGRMPARYRPSRRAARSISRVVAAQRLMSPIPESRPTNESDSRIIKQTKLLKIIYDAISTEPGEGDSMQEDMEGRNGFHALAEVIIGVKHIEKHANLDLKRKHDKVCTDNPSDDEPTRRIKYLEGLVIAGVDVNHYNTAGDTPLMVFVVRLSDGATKAEKDEVRSIIKELVAKGADMERRNRRGETALQVAARHGQKVAVDTLLSLGANPYVRNSDGDSVLDVVDSMWKVSEGDDTSSYEACRKLCGPPMVVTPKQTPSEHDEWTFRPRAIGQGR
ncbi:ankyrin repeat domain-containing protein 50 [Microdochium nivale]|nr:ankyrin repeat domain-containing protein 50 [Microdochium nivale]